MSPECADLLWFMHFSCKAAPSNMSVLTTIALLAREEFAALKMTGVEPPTSYVLCHSTGVGSSKAKNARLSISLDGGDIPWGRLSETIDFPSNVQGDKPIAPSHWRRQPFQKNMSEVISETVVKVGSGTSHSDASWGMPSIKLKTEPDAATLTTKDKAEGDILKDSTQDETLEVVNDAFIVCDVSGGKVDSISYEVQQLDPLKIKQRAIGDGGLSSSMFLDPSFQKSIQTIVGEAQSSTVKKSKRKKTNGFEYGIKRTSSEKNDQVYSVDLQGVKKSSKTSVVDDTLTVTIDALRVVFDHVSLQIQNLLTKQIAQVSEKGLSVKSIMLVGGFGDNRYLCLDGSTLLILDLHIEQ